MLESVRLAIPILLGAILAVVAVVFGREGIRLLKRRRWEKIRGRCRREIEGIAGETAEGLRSRALAVKKSFPLPIIESALQEIGEERRISEEVLRSLYETLGILEFHLRRLQEGSGWTDRAGAAERLGAIGHPSAVLPLVAVMQDATEEVEVRRLAVRALGEIRDPRAIPSLVEGLARSDPSTGQPLADVLTGFGPLVVPPLIEALTHSRVESQRMWAAHILGSLAASASVPALLISLNDHSERVRQTSALSLGKIGDPRAVRYLRESILRDPAPLVRESAAEALGQMGDAKAIESLKQAMADMEFPTRMRAMEALEGMGEKAEPIFREVLESGEPEARTQAAMALERLGFVNRSLEALSSEDPNGVARVLFRMAESGIAESIIRSLAHPNLGVRMKLCEILRDARHPRAAEVLLEVAKTDAEWPVRLRALEALIRLGEERSIPVIAQSLRQEDETVRETLLASMHNFPVRLLSLMRGEILACFHDANVPVRLQVASLLGRMPSEEVIEPLLTGLSDAAPEVRREVVRSLGHRGADQPEDRRGQMARVVVPLLEDSSKEVFGEAVQALKKLRVSDTIEPLAHAFERADEDIRDEISMALVVMPRAGFLDRMDRLMGLEHPKARAGIAWTLGLLGEEKVLAPITFFLRDRVAMVRSAAAGAIGTHFESTGGMKDSKLESDLIPLLVPCLEDPDEMVRASMINALSRIRQPSFVDVLLPLLDHEPDSFVCRRVVLGVGALSVEREESHLPLIDHYRPLVFHQIRRWKISHPDLEDQIAALLCLVLWRDDTSRTAAFQSLQDERSSRRIKQTLKTLSGKIGDRFLEHLSYDRALFWKEGSKKTETAAHYSRLLRGSHFVSERILAVEALGVLGLPETTPFLEAALAKDPDPTVRALALRTIARFLSPSRLVEKINLAARDPSEEVREEVLPILRRLSPRDLEGQRERLLPLLDVASRTLREEMATILGRLYAHDWHHLADNLLGTDRKYRILGLIETIGRIGDARTGPLILQFLKHPDAEVRAVSARWVSELGSLSHEELIPYLEDPQEEVRVSVLKTLQSQISPTILPHLLRLVEDPSLAVRLELALVLGKKKIGGDDRPVEALRRLSGDANTQVRAQALISLFQLGERGVGAKFREGIAQMEEGEKKETLDRMEKEGVQARLVSQLLHEKSEGTRKEAVEILALCGLEKFSGEIAQALGDPSSKVRLAAVEALRDIESDALQVRLEALMQDPVEEVRRAVKRRRLRSVT